MNRAKPALFAVFLLGPGCMFFKVQLDPGRAPSDEATVDDTPVDDTPVSGETPEDDAGMPGDTGPATDTGVTGPTTAPGCVACGAACAPCALGETCAGDEDCASDYCNGEGRCAVLCPQTSRTADGPVLFFTDLTSGPNTGGEDDAGAILTLYGLRFGTAPGSVTVGGGPVARIIDWASESTDDFRARKLERVIVQLGPLTQSGAVVLTTDAGQKSNADVSFTVRPGQIHLVDYDAVADGDGSWQAPWNTIYSARKPTVTAGSVVYIKGPSAGTHVTTIDPTDVVPGHQMNWILDGRIAAVGSADNPVAYVGYPGRRPVIGGHTNGDHSHRVIAIIADGGDLGSYTLANLALRRAELGVLGTISQLRLVGTTMFDQTVSSNQTLLASRGAPTTDFSLKVLGNLIRSTSISLVHLNNTTSDTEIAWNESRGNSSLAAVRIAPINSSVAISGVAIRGNLQRDQAATAVYIGERSRTVVIENNLFLSSSSSTGVDFIQPVAATAIALRHNTLRDRSPSFMYCDDTITASPTATWQNNLSTTNIAGTWFGGDCSLQQHSFSNNIWNGAAGQPLDPSPITTDPLLDADHMPNRLGSANDAGIPTTVCGDYYGRQRHPTTPDIGAVEN